MERHAAKPCAVRLARIGGTPVTKEIDYVRTIATDDKVLRALVAELQLRLPTHVKRRVVLLAERDSLYAQALVSELRFRLSDPKGPQYHPNLHLETRYFYRGLDGATTFDSAPERPVAAKDKDSKPVYGKLAALAEAARAAGLKF